MDVREKRKPNMVASRQVMLKHHLRYWISVLLSARVFTGSLMRE